MYSKGLLSGKIAVVTGAAAGIGLATALIFAREGAQVVVVDIDNKGGSDAVNQCNNICKGKHFFINANVVNKVQVINMIEKVLDSFGRIDVLVNCAGGFNKSCYTTEITEEEWDHILNLNLKSVFLCCQAVIPIMIKQKYGRIVNISSAAGRTSNTLSASHYVASKAGILGFTRHLAKELGPHGITVNSTAPGTTHSPRISKVRPPEFQKKVAELTPLGRLGEPEEQGEAILFLASDRASYITGAILDVNGGRVMM